MTNDENHIPAKPVSVKRLADLRGVSVRTVNKTIASSNGHLVKHNGKILIAEWDAYRARKLAPADDAKPIESMTWDARKERAAALTKELELERARGKLVDLSEVQAAFTQFNAELLSVLRRKLEAELPGKFTGDIALQVAQESRAVIDDLCARINRQERKLGCKS